MSSPTLITPNATTPKHPPHLRSKLTTTTTAAATATTTTSFPTLRRNFLSLSAVTLLSFPVPHALAASDEEYVKDTSDAISKIRTAISLDKNDPNIAAAVAELRDTSNYWVAKYRKEKTLLSRASFREMYSALNAVSGHYVSFGPTAPIPAKRKQRILEEMETAEKALQRGR